MTWHGDFYTWSEIVAIERDLELRRSARLARLGVTERPMPALWPLVWWTLRAIWTAPKCCRTIMRQCRRPSTASKRQPESF